MPKETSSPPSPAQPACYTGVLKPCSTLRAAKGSGKLAKGRSSCCSCSAAKADSGCAGARQPPHLTGAAAAADCRAHRRLQYLLWRPPPPPLPPEDSYICCYRLWRTRCANSMLDARLQALTFRNL